jgi:hypothetical protein
MEPINDVPGDRCRGFLEDSRRGLEEMGNDPFSTFVAVLLLNKHRCNPPLDDSEVMIMFDLTYFDVVEGASHAR